MGVDSVMRTQPIVKEESSFVGIDYHKRYSVFCVLDAQGEVWKEDASIISARSNLLCWCSDGLDAAWCLKPV